MTRMPFSFRSAPDQLGTGNPGSTWRKPDLNMFKSGLMGAMRSTKGEQTRAAIAEAALRMFREHGYEATTMRAIAKEAGVATGNAYYYFESKEELIQEYYARNQTEHAAEPASPLSPFSKESSPTRNAAIALYAEVIAASRLRVPAVLRDRLPELLWLYSMGIVLYWVHDTSPGCEKTYRLIDSTAPLAERLILLARFPGLRSLTRRLLRVADDVLH
jgi:AcrR family transcriptional regulator